ncbi:MAG: hypothetical protein ACI32F_05010, partial [Allobaculum sp.]
IRTQGGVRGQLITCLLDRMGRGDFHDRRPTTKTRNSSFCFVEITNKRKTDTEQNRSRMSDQKKPNLNHLNEQKRN